MPQENSLSNADQVRKLFADVLQNDEKLKVRVGQTVLLNDSSAGKPQDRLDAQVLSSIETAILNDSGDRIDIPLTNKGNQKVPDIEVVGVSGKGKEGERVLFRQEKSLDISVNEVGDLIKTLTEVLSPDIGDLSETDTQLNETTPQPIEQADKSTAIIVFAQTVGELPQSKTKALWGRIATDFKALGQQLKGVGQKGREIASAIKEAPDAVKQDATALADRTKQQLADAKQSVQTTIAQTSIDDVTSTAIKGAGAVAEAASKGLGIANLYLKNRADKVKSYGMAKAALRLYNKGHARTGESIFTANNYTVEAVTDGFKVKDPQDRLLMSFGTDKQGRPISVTKEASLQSEHYRQINQASKLPVIEGSPAAEAVYAQRVSKIVENLKEVVSEGDTLSGRSFHISREDTQTISLTTQGIPRRTLAADLSNGAHSSTLTMEDLEQVEANIEASTSIQKQYTAVEVSASEPKKSAQVEMV